MKIHPSLLLALLAHSLLFFGENHLSAAVKGQQDAQEAVEVLGWQDCIMWDECTPCEPFVVCEESLDSEDCGGCSGFVERTPKPRKLTKQEIKDLKAQGEIVYDEYGNAWHPRRSRNEFTAAQWKTILLFHRVRVPFTADDHRALLELFVGQE